MIALRFADNQQMAGVFAAAAGKKQKSYSKMHPLEEPEL
jgi:hypothetical protein